MPNVTTRAQMGLSSDNGEGPSQRTNRQAVVSTEDNGFASSNNSINDNTDEDTGDNLGELADILS